MAEQVVVESLVAVQLRTDAYEVDVALHQFRAHFVHSTVGVRQQHYVRMFVGEFLLQNVEQSERSLSCSRRSDNQEYVARLLGMFHQSVEPSVFAAHVYMLVYGRRALTQYQVAALLICRQKTVQTAVQSACRRFKHVVLYSPTSAFGRIKHLLVGLRIAQHHLNALCRYLLYRCAVYHLGAGVGHVALLVWIDYHDVALAEIGRVGSLFHVKPQSQALHHTIG